MAFILPILPEAQKTIVQDYIRQGWTLREYRAGVVTLSRKYARFAESLLCVAPSGEILEA